MGQKIQMWIPCRSELATCEETIWSVCKLRWEIINSMHRLQHVDFAQIICSCIAMRNATSLWQDSSINIHPNMATLICDASGDHLKNLLVHAAGWQTMIVIRSYSNLMLDFFSWPFVYVFRKRLAILNHTSDMSRRSGSFIIDISRCQLLIDVSG